MVSHIKSLRLYGGSAQVISIQKDFGPGGDIQAKESFVHNNTFLEELTIVQLQLEGEQDVWSAFL